MAKWGDTPRNVTLTIRITEEDKQQLKLLATKEGVKVSYLAYQMLQKELKQKENER